MNIRPEIGATHTVGFLLTPNFSMIAFTAADRGSAPHQLRHGGQGLRLAALFARRQAARGVERRRGVRSMAAMRDVGPMPEIIVCAGLDVQNTTKAS